MQQVLREVNGELVSDCHPAHGAFLHCVGALGAADHVATRQEDDFSFGFKANAALETLI
jgi:hypothetical protein